MKSCCHPSVAFRAEFRHFRNHSILFEGSRRSFPVGYADVRIFAMLEESRAPQHPDPFFGCRWHCLLSAKNTPWQVNKPDGFIWPVRWNFSQICA
jgi:hypothetical protein